MQFTAMDALVAQLRSTSEFLMQQLDNLPPIEQCLSTPFQCIPERVGLAATAWAIFAEQNVNPLATEPVIPD